MTFDAKATRAVNVRELNSRGFKVAPGLPLSDARPILRPTAEIAGRLAAMNLLFLYVGGPENRWPATCLLKYAEQNNLRSQMTEGERATLSMPREDAAAEFLDSNGWRTENAISLAWVLGQGDAPSVDGEMLDWPAIKKIVLTPDPLDPDAYPRWLSGLRPRAVAEVAALEDLFYCAHNAVRSAQIELMEAGGRPSERYSTVPAGLDPIAGGGVIHERRHALTWVLSPGVSWEETDLST